ncbi:CoA ester lyase [Halobacteriales archaeon QH_10_65_19]|jgi:citrate lyase subunit beta/citryl-CoA lyase|nr:MAG: CoA ester lyase [Halobacteriales archaeon QH_10_65_19]
MVRRTVLFSPGDRPELLWKAPESGADVIVFDLEDAVAPGKKAAGRDAVRDVVTEIDPDAELCVRVNRISEGGGDDVAAVFGGSEETGVDSVMLPKVASAGAVEELATVLAEHGRQLPVLALLETASGVLHAEPVARADATDAVLLGAEDLAADIGATRTGEGTEILHAREQVVLAAGGAGVDAIDTLYTDYEDTEGLAEDARFGRDLGFDGKMVIHPGQVPVVNDAFTPDETDVEWARTVLAARDDAGDDVGVFSVEGEMIDAPLIAQAEDIVSRYQAATGEPDGPS